MIWGPLGFRAQPAHPWAGVAERPAASIPNWIWIWIYPIWDSTRYRAIRRGMPKRSPWGRYFPYSCFVARGGYEPSRGTCNHTRRIRLARHGNSGRSVGPSRPGPWALGPVPGSRAPGPGPGPLGPVPWSRALSPGPWSNGPGPWSLVPRVPGPGPWSQGSQGAHGPKWRPSRGRPRGPRAQGAQGAPESGPGSSP